MSALEFGGLSWFLSSGLPVLGLHVLPVLPWAFLQALRLAPTFKSQNMQTNKLSPVCLFAYVFNKQTESSLFVEDLRL